VGMPYWARPGDGRASLPVFVVDGLAGCDETQPFDSVFDRCSVASYPDVRGAVAWLEAALGFVERVRIANDERA
jgi:hypothetical protein